MDHTRYKGSVAVFGSIAVDVEESVEGIRIDPSPPNWKQYNAVNEQKAASQTYCRFGARKARAQFRFSLPYPRQSMAYPIEAVGSVNE